MPSPSLPSKPEPERHDTAPTFVERSTPAARVPTVPVIDERLASASGSERAFWFEVRREVIGDIHQSLFCRISSVRTMAASEMIRLLVEMRLTPDRIPDMRGLAALAARKLIQQAANPGFLCAKPELPKAGHVFRYISATTPKVLFNDRDFSAPGAFFQLYQPNEKGVLAVWQDSSPVRDRASLDEVFVFLAKLEGFGSEMVRQVAPELEVACGSETLGNISFYLSPEIISFKADGAHSFARHYCFKVPFGALPHTKEEMLARQLDIEQGRLVRATVNVSGRIDPGFLAWAQGAGVLSAGPIPDVEILYTLRLPSGAPYTIALKESRRGSQAEPNPLHLYKPEDWETVRHLGNYMLNPGNRARLEIFCDFRGAAAQAAQTMPKVIDNAEDVKAYLALREQWTKGVHQELLAAHREFRAPIEVDWLEQRFSEASTFNSIVQERLDVIPAKYPFRTAGFFQLNVEERAEFVRHYVPIIFKVCAEERARIASEQQSDQCLMRERLGYRGPEEGYPLSLDYMIMDMIIDYRARKSFVQNRARERGLRPEEVVIPEHIGRRYDRPQRFMGVGDIPRILSERGSQRTVEARFFDPKSQQVETVTGETAVRDKLNCILNENVARARVVIGEFKNSAQYRQGHEHRSSPWHNGPRLGVLVLEGISRSCTQSENQLNDAISATARALARLTMSRAGEPKVARERIGAEAAKHDRLIGTLREAADRSKIALVELTNYVLRDYSQTAFVRVEEILDYDVIRFACSIGADCRPILSEEQMKREGRTRMTHSEQLGGKNMYGGGFLLVGRHFEVFHDAREWRAFADGFEQRELQPWRALKITNDSGHYFPGLNTLQFTSNCIFKELDVIGIDHSGCVVADALSPGIRTASLIRLVDL
ncbi:MAG: hypothetical protein K1X79_02445 [Oligoflexia bacterium]|nr:hypothetical protein [Oligoflexia bacterium]